jgi:SAM-dependent methyltransferase
MSDAVRSFYDQLAADYHLIFEDWEASMARQAAALAPILESECGSVNGLRVLDCACGIGTQSLGLARLGCWITGCDLSSAAVERARREAGQRGLDVRLLSADLLDLSAVPDGNFDAAIAMDNVLPHLDTDDQILQAARQVRGKLRQGGVFLASIRDYDRLAREKPVVQGPAFYADGGRRRIVHQVWDWLDDHHYVVHLYITLETAAGWAARHYVSRYRALLREELEAILRRAGFAERRWVFPGEGGFYQPLVIAKV